MILTEEKRKLVIEMQCTDKKSFLSNFIKVKAESEIEQEIKRYLVRLINSCEEELYPKVEKSNEILELYI